jgi:opacity protein-like surface antigen
LRPQASPGRKRCACGAAAAAALAAAALAPDAAVAQEAAVTLGPIAGTIVLDSHLSDYRWDTRARAVWGAAGRADLGRLGGGLRVWRASTTQGLGIPGEDERPRVSLTGVELLGETRVASFAGVRLLASATAGLLRIAWSPDAVTVDDGTGQSIEVGFAPISEWTGGAGLGLRREIAGGLEAGVVVERSWFRLDTTHRAGGGIVTERETFGNWTARVELTHRILQI